MGNVELFQLFETDPKTQCNEYFSYWCEDIVYYTYGYFLKVQPTETSSNVHCFFFHFQTPWLITDDFVITYDRKLLYRKKNINKSVLWERDASRRILKGFAFVSWEIQYFVNLTTNIIELQRFVSKWTSFLTMSPITWCKKVFSIEAKLMDLSR